MSKLNWGFLSAAALAAAMGLAGAAGAQTKLIYSTYIPESYSVVACDGFFMEEVAKRTGGKIVFERYYASSLLNAVDTVPGVGRGAADFGGGTAPGAYNRAQFPVSNILMPWITDNYVASMRAATDLYHENADFQAEYEKQNVKLLYAVVPPAHSFWSREPIRTAADFKGKRVRAVLAIGEAVAKMGGVPVAMAFPDGLEAMNRGAIEVMGNVPFDLGVTAGLNKVAKHVTDAGRMGTFSFNSSVISLKRWKSLPSDVQQVMLQVAKEVPDCFHKIAQRDVEKAADVLIADKDVRVNVFASDEAKKLRETLGRQLWKDWVDLVNKSGYGGQKLLDRYLELVAKYEKEYPVETGYDIYKRKVGK